MFELDPQLARDTLMLGDLPLSRLLLMNDARYPWFILVPRREEVTEVFQLDAADQARLWGEVAMLAEKIKDTFGAQKMNIASWGTWCRRCTSMLWRAAVTMPPGRRRSGGGGLRFPMTPGRSRPYGRSSSWC